MMQIAFLLVTLIVGALLVLGVLVFGQDSDEREDRFTPDQWMDTPNTGPRSGVGTESQTDNGETTVIELSEDVSDDVVREAITNADEVRFSSETADDAAESQVDGDDDGDHDGGAEAQDEDSEAGGVDVRRRKSGSSRDQRGDSGAADPASNEQETDLARVRRSDSPNGTEDHTEPHGNSQLGGFDPIPGTRMEQECPHCGRLMAGDQCPWCSFSPDESTSDPSDSG